MIVAALLYDLKSFRVVVSASFMRKETEQGIVQSAVERYHELVQTDSKRRCVPLTVDDTGVCLQPVGEMGLVIGISDSHDVSAEDLRRMGEFKKRLGDRVPREIKGSFAKEFDSGFRKSVSFCFITSESPSAEDKAGTAIVNLMHRLGATGMLSRPLPLGPLAVSVAKLSADKILGASWPSELESVDALAVITGLPVMSGSTFGNLLSKIRKSSSSPVLIIPSSDDQLEAARELETRFDVQLCDFVSGKPTDLLLSVSATAGLTDMHPELARETWKMDDTVDEMPRPKTAPVRVLGHQAFFVIDSKTGEPVFTYYYESKSKVLERAPNVVAAISMFDLDSTSPNKTSVFQTGDLKFAIIERERLIFTLITGDKEDVESIRSRFSFLPDLYFDEAPEIHSNPDDLYAAPAFAIKLLATLPPEHLGSRMVPYRVREPEWSRFQSDAVSDFLKAVWKTLDGKRNMSQLAAGSGPVMVLGAIHLLKKMGAISAKPVVLSSEVPSVVADPDRELFAMYSHLKEILNLTDGRHSITEIGEAAGVTPSVLVMVFSELHKRGCVEFSAEKSTSLKAS